MSADIKNTIKQPSKMATKTPIKKRGKNPTLPPASEPTELEQVEQPVITFKTTKEKGDAYEIFIKHQLIDSGNYEWVYLWKDVPEAELFESGIMDDWNQARIVRKAGRSEGLIGDIGTDLLIKAKDGKYSLVQCKHYNNENILRIEDLGTFYFMMMNYSQYVNGIIYYTSKLSKLLNEHSKKVNSNIKYNLEPFNAARYIELMNTIYKPTDNDSSNIKLTPRDYQLEAIGQLRDKQRTVCQLPCGMGKTLIAIKLAEQYNQVIVITPLKIYCEQNMERFKSQMSGEYSMMIIDSDNDGRNIDKIKTFIGNNEKICLFATFKSVDIVNKLISDKVVNNYYVIIDEFHNLSINDILEDDLEDNLEEELLDEVNQENGNSEDDLEDFEDYEEEDNLEYSDDDIEEPENNQSEMYKLLHSDARILFMSATPKLMGSDNDYSEDCDIDEEIFGNIDYKMDMRTAIDRGGICDYMVYVPTLSIEKSTGLDKIQEEVDIIKYDKELVIKARFIIRGMMNNGSRKCIVYLQTQEECRLMNTILADVGTNYFAIDVNSNYVIADSSREERKAIIKSFTDGEGYNFLCNVNILNECIDVPECDSIFIAYPSKSKIRNIQRMCRANRKNKAMVDKIARIYIWADEYKDEIVDFIGHLKEYDSQFTFDRVKRLNVIENKTAIMKSSDAVEENKKLEGLVVGVKGISDWLEKLEEVKKFIDEHGRRPTKKDNKYLNKWLQHQITNSRNRLQNMKIDEIYNLWNNFIANTKYAIYFIDNFAKWKQILDEVKTFINLNKLRPTYNTHKKLAQWITIQKITFKKKNGIMKNKEIYNLWYEFINDKDYNKYVVNNPIEIWKTYFENLKIFLDKNNKRPQKNNKELYSWTQYQVNIFKNKRNIMKNEYIYSLWYNFINDPKYDKYFKTYEEEWNNTFKKIKQFIDLNKKRPTHKTDKYLCAWITRQTINFNDRVDLMSKPHIYDLWNNFINDTNYKLYFQNNEEQWKYNLELLKTYLDNNKLKPTEKTNKELCLWIRVQTGNYKYKKNIMLNEIIVKLWENFIESDKYSKYFEKKDNVDEWNQHLIELKKFIDTENKLPTRNSNQILQNWLNKQKHNFTHKTQIMKEQKIRDIWLNFISISEYKKYFV